jgi:hypothetical protein
LPVFPVPRPYAYDVACSGRFKGWPLDTRKFLLDNREGAKGGWPGLVGTL